MYYKSRRLFVWLLTITFLLTQIIVSPVFAQGSDTGAGNGTGRISGADRYQTAVAVSQKGWKTAEYAVLARGDNFADALCAGPLAQKYGGPILLTSPTKLNNDTLNELKRLGVKHLFIAGGFGAVSQSVEDALKAGGIETIERIYGDNRYETSVKIAEKIGDSSKVVLATGGDFPDALSISAIAANLGMPILLTAKDSLPSVVNEYFQAKEITATYIVGGTGIISTDIEKKVPGAKRLAGNNRYETNKVVMQNFEQELNFENIYVAVGGGARGNEFADALTGAVLAARTSSPLVLTASSLPAGTADYLKGKLLLSTRVTGLGGKNVVPSAVLTELIAFKEQLSVAEKYSTAGTYGPETGKATVQGSVTISARDVILQNTIIEGDLLLGQSIGDGNVTLRDVTVKGKTIVNGGGPNSIIMYNFNGQTVIVDVPEGSNVRLVAQGNTSVESVSMEGNGTLEESDLSGTGFVNIQIPAGAQVTLSGTFNEVTVEASGANVTVASGSITTMTIAETAAGAGINLAGGTNVTTLNANAPSNVTGQGQITTANVNTNNVTIEQKPENTTVASGVTANVGGEQQTGTGSPTTGSGGSGGGGGGGPRAIAVSDISNINTTTFTFKSVKVDSIKVGNIVVAMTGSTAPYAAYDSGTGAYTVTLAEPLTVGDHTVTLTKSGYRDTTVTLKVKMLVEYYTGTDFHRSRSPIVESSGNVIQTIKSDGSIEITVSDVDYIDSGIVMGVGTLGELGAINTQGSGDYNLNIYLDLDGSGFFNWDNDIYEGVGGDSYLTLNDNANNGVIQVNDASSFYSMTEYKNYTLAELKGKYPADTPVGVWLGVTSMDGTKKTATISAITVTEANVTDFAVEYYTGTGFKRSMAPIVESSGNVSQLIGIDGSIAITVKNTGYIDSGFVMEAGTLGELQSIEVQGTGNYGLNLYFDIDEDGEFFKFDSDGNYLQGSSSDAYALYQGPYGNTILINDQSSFNLMGTGGGVNTVSSLKEKYPADTLVGIWVGVTSSNGSEKSATISSVEITKMPVVNETTGQGYTTIQAAIDAVYNLPDPAAPTTYTLSVSRETNEEEISIIQDTNKNIVLQAALNGEDYSDVTLRSRIKIDGDGRYNGAESLRIKGFTFNFSEATGDIIYTAAKIPGGKNIYAHNIFIEDCEFIGNPDVVAVRFAAGGGHRNANIINSTGTNLHSFGQFTSVEELTITDCTITGGGSGLNLFSSSNVEITAFEFEGDGYGIRAGQSSGIPANTTLTITDSNIISTSSCTDENLGDPNTALVLRGDAPKNIIIADSTIMNSNAGSYDIANINVAHSADFRFTFDNVNWGSDGKKLGGLAGSVDNILEVDASGGAEYTSIQAAIEAANSGDTILVAAGTYNENPLSISKQITLMGAGDETIVQAQTSTALLRIAEDGVVVRNIKLLGAEGENKGAGIKIASTVGIDGLTIEFCTIEGFTQGIYADTNANEEPIVKNVLISDSLFINNTNKGIYIEKLSESEILNCQFVGNGTNPDATGNPLADASGAGIDINAKYADYKDITIEDCTFTNNGTGTEYGGAILIKARGTGTDSYSDNPASLTNVQIIDCEFYNNSKGIVLGEHDKGNLGPEVMITNPFYKDNNEDLVDYRSIEP